jgi:4'-phosphopantetheinyl transferase
VTGCAGALTEVAPGVTVIADRIGCERHSTSHTSEDRSRAATLPPWRAAEYLAARGLLRTLLTTVAGSRAARGTIAALPSGQPYLPGEARIGISLAHSGDVVAAAVAVGGRAGVDVQQPEPASEAVLRRCCTPAALSILHTFPPERRTAEFAWIWSVQEACVKAAGTGLAGRPWAIPVEPGQDSGEWNGYSWRTLRAHSTVPLACAYARD